MIMIRTAIKLVLTGIAAAGLSALAGCGTIAPGGHQPAALKVSGDPGVQFHVIVTDASHKVYDRWHTVPAELEFFGRDLDILCVHGETPGRMEPVVHRRGSALSAGECKAPGQGIRFKVRRGELTGTPETVPISN
jgi:hypothetical protein